MQNKAKLSLPITNHYLIFKNWRAGPNSIGYQISGRYNRTTVLKYWRVIWFCDRSAWTSCYAPYYLWSGGATGQLEPGVQPRTTCDLVVRPVSLNQVSSPIPMIWWCDWSAWTRCPASYYLWSGDATGQLEPGVHCPAPYYLWSGRATGQLEPGVQPCSTCDLVVRPASLNQVSSPVLGIS